MEIVFDLNEFRRIISDMPERISPPVIRTEGFNHLYQTVYLPLVGYDPDGYESKYLNVNTGKFSFDDLLEFYEFLSRHYEGISNSPLSTLDAIISKLPPIFKKQNFI